MSKAKIIFKILALVSIPITGFLGAKGAEWYDMEMCQIYLEKVDTDVTKRDKVKAFVKAYGPAIGSAIAGIASVIFMDRIGAKALLSAGALVAAGKAKLDDQVEMGKAYRQATIDAVGPEKEAEIRTNASNMYACRTFVNGEATDETVHTFVIDDWIEKGSHIEFDAPMANVYNAFCETNRELFDHNSGDGTVSIADFLTFIGGEASCYANEVTEAYGWNDCALVDNDCLWVPFSAPKVKGRENTYQILTHIYPNFSMHSDYPLLDDLVDDEEGVI